MEIKGVAIQNQDNYYKILAIIRKKYKISALKINSLNSFLEGKITKQQIMEECSGIKDTRKKEQSFSAVRGLAFRESYSFFKVE